MKIALICVTYNNWNQLSKCLESIYKHTENEYHLFLIDNNSSDATVGLYGMTLPNTTIIRNMKNVWWGGGINQGIRLSKDFDYVFFLNDDIEVPMGWDAKHVDILREEPSIGAVGPLNSNKRDWQGYDRVREHFKDLNLPTVSNVNRKDILGMNRALEPLGMRHITVRGMLAFFCVGFRRNVIDEIGELDERFIMGGDDDDYARRLDAKGYGLGLLLNTYVIHHGGSSINKMESDFNRNCKNWNIALLRSKHPEFYGNLTEADKETLKTPPC